MRSLTIGSGYDFYQPTCYFFIYWRFIHWTNHSLGSMLVHDDVIKWKHFPRYWSFVRGIHRSPVNSTHKGQWRGALMFSLICDWINGWVNNRGAGDLRRYRAHYDVTVMCFQSITSNAIWWRKCCAHSLKLYLEVSLLKSQHWFR